LACALDVKKNVPLEKIALQEPSLVLTRHRVKNVFERLAHCARCVLETVIQFIKDAVEDGLAACSEIQTKISSTKTTLLRVATSFFNTHPPPQSWNAA
jgi:hypothetical protein